MLRKILKSFGKKQVEVSGFFYLYLFIFWLMNISSEKSIDTLRAEAEEFLRLPINPEMRLVLEEFVGAVGWRDGDQTAKAVEKFLFEKGDK